MIPELMDAQIPVLSFGTIFLTFTALLLNFVAYDKFVD